MLICFAKGRAAVLPVVKAMRGRTLVCDPSTLIVLEAGKIVCRADNDNHARPRLEVRAGPPRDPARRG
jgi:hypothetical protein